MTNTGIINLVWRTASQFDIDRALRYVNPQPRVVLDGIITDLYGYYDITRNIIVLRTHSMHKRPRPLRDFLILDTAAHELAHIVEQRHGKAHKLLTRALLTWMRAEIRQDVWDAQKPLAFARAGIVQSSKENTK